MKTRTLLAVFLMAASSIIAAAPTSVSAAPEPQSIEPQAITPSSIGGSENWATAPLLQFNTGGSFWGVFNSSSGSIETVRGYLHKDGSASEVLSHYFRIELPKGKVLKAVVTTENPSYFVDGNNVLQITPNFQTYLYTGVPSVETNIDWNTPRYDARPTQEVNILTPVGGGAPNAYYINVTVWRGSGFYTMDVEVTDPQDIGPGTQDIARTMTAEVDDTHWYRFFATHDDATTNYEEVSGWLEITNFNDFSDATRWHVNAIIRVFTEDLGYAPDNPIGKPIEKSEAPNRKVEPISVLAPYTGYYYIMVRLENTSGSYGWQANYNLHTSIAPIIRFPAGGQPLTHKERFFDDTDWFWFNMTKASGTGQNQRVIFNLSESSDDPLAPVNMNLWLFAKRPYYFDFDILNSSFQLDAPYNLTQNPEPRYEEVAAQAIYTGVYFLEVENFNNSGNYSITVSYDTTPRPDDFNNEPSQAQGTSWGVISNVSVDQSEDHSDFYRISAKAGETIEAYAEMPKRTSEDGSVTNATLGLLFVGIYQPGMILLNWSWNYYYNFTQTEDHLENWTRVRATVAADGDYIVEVTALQDGYIGQFQVSPTRTIQVFWHMDWNMHSSYTMWLSRLPDFNAFPEAPFVLAPLPNTVLQEDERRDGLLNFSSYFGDPDLQLDDRLTYTIVPSGFNNISFTELNGLVSVQPQGNWSGVNTYTVTATDRTRNSVSQKWNFTVTPVNDAPYLVSNSPIRFREDTGVVVLSPVWDYVKDVDGDPLTFTQVPDANVTLVFTNTTIRITTAPDFQTSSLGADYPVAFDVTDGVIASPVRLTIYLNISNELDAPRVLIANPTITCDEDSACPTLDLNAVFYDPDDPTHSVPLTFFLGGSAGYANYTIFNGTLTLTPKADWSGARSMQIDAYKTYNGTLYRADQVELTLIVREINDAPKIMNWSPFSLEVTLTEGQTRPFSIEAVDPEGLEPAYHWTLDGVALGTSLSAYTFLADYALASGNGNRVFVLRVEADDGTGGRAGIQWNVTVVDVPRLPVIAISSPLEGNRGYVTGAPLTFFASAYDPDGDALTYVWTDSSGSTLFSGLSGIYTFTTPGTRRITLTVSDGIGSVSTTINVTVEQAEKTQPGFDAPAIAGALAIAGTVAAVVRRRKGD